MKIVEKATVGDTGWCALTHEIQGPYLDTERWIGRGTSVDEYGYIAVPFVEEMGRAVGMVSHDEHEELRNSARELANLAAEMQGQIEELEKQVAAIQMVKELTAA